MNVNLGSGNCRLSRLDDLRWRRLRRSALAIRTPELVADIWQAVARMRADRPQLASTYTVLRALFGESGRCFDDWKGAFSFPFEIEVSKGSVRFAYLLEVASWRGALEFRFARQLGLAERGFNRSMCYPRAIAPSCHNPKQLGAKFVDRRSEHALGLDARLARRVEPQQVHHDVANDGEIVGSVAGANA